MALIFSIKLIYVCLKSFFLNGIEEIKGIPLFFIAPVENRVDLFFFEKLGFEIENIDLNTELKNKGAQNIIAYFDYYTLSDGTLWEVQTAR